MEFLPEMLQGLFLIPIACGSIYGILCLFTMVCFRTANPPRPLLSAAYWPPVTILKPVCGLEKDLKRNLRSACLQDYPEFQVVLSVQSPDDPSVPVLKELQNEYPHRVSVVIENRRVGVNGKINNLAGALPHARHDILVISDSDINMDNDYLKNIVPPLVDPEVGFVCTLYRATSAGRWFEKMALLNLNADFIPSVVFAYVTESAKFCLGSSVAFRRNSLEEIGGFDTLGDYLVEDYEMGRRLWISGKKVVLVPYVVDTVIDLKDIFQWWNYQVTWDQKTRAANPMGFFATIMTKSVPFALLLAVFRWGDVTGLTVLGGVLAVRMVTAAAIAQWSLRDRETLKSLALIPLRDVAALISWGAAIVKKEVTWRGVEMTINHDGRLSVWKPRK